MSGWVVVIQKLLATQNVVDIVGQRITPAKADDEGVMPYIVVSEVSEVDPQLLGSSSKMPNARISVTMIGPSAATVLRMKRAVVAALEDVTNERIADYNATILRTETSLFDYSLDRTAYRGVVDFNVRWS